MTKSVYTLLLLFLFSCHSANTKTSRNLNLPVSDTIVRDIPLDNSGRPNFWFPLVREAEKGLFLDSLNGGVDSLEIRIWMGGGLAWIDHTAIIKVLNGHPSCKLYTYKANRKDNGPDSISDVSVRTIAIDNKFIDSLIDNRILTLPNGPPGGLDGTQYCLQVATRHSYRFYSYWSPSSGKDKASENMVEIIRLLENKCDFQQ